MQPNLALLIYYYYYYHHHYHHLLHEYIYLDETRSVLRWTMMALTKLTILIFIIIIIIIITTICQNSIRLCLSRSWIQ